MNTQTGRTYFILLIFLMVIFLYHLVGYTGHYGYDDIHYAGLAADLLKGKIHIDDHYAYRLPVILLTSFFYLMFGISDLSSSLPALLVSILILFTVFNLLKEHGPQVLMIGLSLCTFSNWFLFYSDKLMPDSYVALSVIWALAVIHRYKYKSDKQKPAPFAILLALSLFFGFLAKGTIVLILPLLLYLILSDFLLKRDQKFWVYSLLSGTILLSLYLTILWIATGNPLKRFDAIAGNSYLNLCSYDQQSLKILLKRIFLDFFKLAIFQSLAIAYIFVFARLFRRKSLQIFSMENSQSFFLASAVILFLSSSFMTISLRSYSPMCLDPRHYLFLIPVGAVPASRIIMDYLTDRKDALRIIGILLGVTLISIFLPGDRFLKHYVPLSLLFVMGYFIKSQRSLHFFIPLFALMLLLLPLDMIRYARQVQYRKQRSLIKEQVLARYPGDRIITNEVQKRLLKYYSGFQEDIIPQFISYEELENNPELGEKGLLLLNWHTRYLSGMQENDLPVFARHIPENVYPVFENKDLKLALYPMKDLDLADPCQKPLLSSCNGFESALPFWFQETKDISGKIKYEGAKSNAVAKYSSTFVYPLDSLLKEGPQDLMIRCDLFCYAEDQTDAMIVISLEDDEGTYFWESLEVNRYLKAYSNWWPVRFETLIGNKEIKSDSRIKIYVRRTSPPAVYIDNFCIKVCIT